MGYIYIQKKKKLKRREQNCLTNRHCVLYERVRRFMASVQ